MSEAIGRPTLILVTGPGGAGKTTLARLIASEVGCPAISRDEIKEGMVAATADFVPAASDPLTLRTYDVFFAVLRLLLEHGVTLVAEASFQHHNWVRQLEPLRAAAELRIIRCHVPTEVRRGRAERRRQEVATRAAHDDTGYFAADGPFDPIRMDAPTLDVDTRDGYRPELAAIIYFAAVGRVLPESGSVHRTRGDR